MTPAYSPIPLPDRSTMTPEESLACAERLRERFARRHTVREFSDHPVDRRIIEHCIAAAASAPSGANQQPWHFVAIGPGLLRKQLRAAAEAEERAFYAGRGGEEWLQALGPLGTDPDKPFLETAPWLIAVFAQRHGLGPQGRKVKHYYVPESVGIATGFLISALHECGLATLTHTPSPMTFLGEALHRPTYERAYMLIITGHPAPDATVPAHAKLKKPEREVMSVV